MVREIQGIKRLILFSRLDLLDPMQDEPMDFDDPIERRKWLARLVASAKGHARKVGRPFELTTEFIETVYGRKKGRSTLPGINSTRGAFLIRSSSTPSRRALIAGRQAAGIRRITGGSCALQSQDHGNRAARSASSQHASASAILCGCSFGKGNRN
jgi:hypothetical protein